MELYILCYYLSLFMIRSILPRTLDSQMERDIAINYALCPLDKCTISDTSRELGVLDRFHPRNVKVNSTGMPKPSLNYD